MKNWNQIVLESNENPLNGKTLQQARVYLQKLLLPLINGRYTDDYWHGPKKVWDTLKNANVDFGMIGSKYNKDKSNPTGPDTSKDWQIEFIFTNEKGKEATINAILVAHGAGSVKEPLDAYDMTMNIN